MEQYGGMMADAQAEMKSVSMSKAILENVDIKTPAFRVREPTEGWDRDAFSQEPPVQMLLSPLARAFLERESPAMKKKIKLAGRILEFLVNSESALLLYQVFV